MRRSPISLDRAALSVFFLILVRPIPAVGFQSAPPLVKNAPSFEAFPVPRSEVFKGTPASPRFKTPGQRNYRTMIRLTAEKGPNFAGHFAVGEWGCGTACVQMAIVDVRSGDVYEGPFGPLPFGGHIYLGTGSEEDHVGVFYRQNSNLFIAAGCPKYRNCGTYFYEWNGSQFKLLRRVPVKPLFGGE